MNDYLHTVMLLSLHGVFTVVILTIIALMLSSLACRIAGDKLATPEVKKSARKTILLVGGAVILLVVALKATSPSALPKNKLETPNTLDKIELLDKEELRESVETPLNMEKVEGAMDGTEDSKERTREMLDWKSEE